MSIDSWKNDWQPWIWVYPFSDRPGLFLATAARSVLLPCFTDVSWATPLNAPSADGLLLGRNSRSFCTKSMSCSSTLQRVKITDGQTHTKSLSGWWLGHPSEKYEFVNWDDEIPNIWENKKWQPNHQPVIYSWFTYEQWWFSIAISLPEDSHHRYHIWWNHGKGHAVILQTMTGFCIWIQNHQSPHSSKIAILRVHHVSHFQTHPVWLDNFKQLNSKNSPSASNQFWERLLHGDMALRWAGCSCCRAVPMLKETFYTKIPGPSLTTGDTFTEKLFGYWLLHQIQEYSANRPFSHFRDVIVLTLPCKLIPFVLYDATAFWMMYYDCIRFRANLSCTLQTAFILRFLTYK